MKKLRLNNCVVNIEKIYLPFLFRSVKPFNFCKGDLTQTASTTDISNIFYITFEFSSPSVNIK